MRRVVIVGEDHENQAKGAKDLGHGRLYPIRWVIAEGIPGADIQAPYWGD